MKRLAAFLFFIVFQLGSWAQVWSPERLEQINPLLEYPATAPQLRSAFLKVAEESKVPLREVIAELQKLEPDAASRVTTDLDYFKLTFLLENGWDWRQKDSQQKTLLEVALGSHQDSLVLLLFRYGAYELIPQKNLKAFLRKHQVLPHLARQVEEWAQVKKTPALAKKLVEESRVRDLNDPRWELELSGESPKRFRGFGGVEESPVAMAPGAGPGMAPEERADKDNGNIVFVPYATNRDAANPALAKVSGSETVAKHFGHLNAAHLQYGFARVSIPPNHQRGEHEIPGFFEFSESLEKHIVVTNLQPTTREAFFTRLKGRANQEKDLFVYIHGFNVSFVAAMQKTAQLIYDLKYPGISLAYSWPARQVRVPVPGDFRRDVGMAQLSVEHLANFLKAVKAEYPNNTIHLVAHSLGTKILADALATLQPIDDKKLFGQIVFASPAIDAQPFSKVSVQKVLASCTHLSIFASNADKALQVQSMAEGPTFSFPLGLWSPEQAALNAGVSHFDVSGISRGFLGHSVYAEVGTALNHLHFILTKRPSEADFEALPYTKRRNRLDSVSQTQRPYWELLE